jgi:RecB family exonuclease
MEWPDADTLETWLVECAEQELREYAVGVPAYARVLARRARPLVDRARVCDWHDGPPAVVGTEVEAVALARDASGGEREIRFFADRVDRQAGRLVLTDYKTGKPLADQKTPAGREDALRKQVAGGRALQAVLYARAGGEGALGRYLFLREDVPDDARSLAVADVPPWTDALDGSLPLLLEAWDRGSFLPRLRQADRDEEPGACRYCEVRDACIRGDSGARARLDRWSERSDPAGDAAERAAAAIYRIGVES